MRGQKPPVKPLGDVINLPGSQLHYPDPPANLEGLERDCWNEVVRELVPRNIWDSDLSDMAQAYCVQRARFITANEKVRELGLILKTKRGTGTHNPYVGASNTAFDRMVRLAQELGLTAARRDTAKKVTAPRGVAADKFLKRGTV
jgi:P27 family predicted phage terminase small subunit